MQSGGSEPSRNRRVRDNSSFITMRWTERRALLLHSYSSFLLVRGMLSHPYSCLKGKSHVIGHDSCTQTCLPFEKLVECTGQVVCETSCPVVDVVIDISADITVFPNPDLHSRS